MYLLIFFMLFEMSIKSTYIYYPMEINTTDEVEINEIKKIHFKLYFQIVIKDILIMYEKPVSGYVIDIFKYYCTVLIKNYANYISYYKNEAFFNKIGVIIDFDELKFNLSIPKDKFNEISSKIEEKRIQIFKIIDLLCAYLTSFYCEKFEYKGDKLLNFLDLHIKVYYYALKKKEIYNKTSFKKVFRVNEDSNYEIKRNNFLEEKNLILYKLKENCERITINFHYLCIQIFLKYFNTKNFGFTDLKKEFADIFDKHLLFFMSLHENEIRNLYIVTSQKKYMNFYLSMFDNEILSIESLTEIFFKFDKIITSIIINHKKNTTLHSFSEFDRKQIEKFFEWLEKEINKNKPTIKSEFTDAKKNNLKLPSSHYFQNNKTNVPRIFLRQQNGKNKISRLKYLRFKSYKQKLYTLYEHDICENQNNFSEHETSATYNLWNNKSNLAEILAKKHQENDNQLQKIDYSNSIYSRQQNQNNPIIANQNGMNRKFEYLNPIKLKEDQKYACYDLWDDKSNFPKNLNLFQNKNPQKSIKDKVYAYYQQKNPNTNIYTNEFSQESDKD